jgi:hypothetical protein
MTPTHNVVGALAVAGKSFKEIEKNYQKGVWRQGLEEDTNLRHHEKSKEGKPAADQRGFNTKRRIRNLVFITNIAAEVESDRCVTERKLVRIHGMSTTTIHSTLHDNLTFLKSRQDGSPNFLAMT